MALTNATDLLECATDAVRKLLGAHVLAVGACQCGAGDDGLSSFATDAAEVLASIECAADELERVRASLGIRSDKPANTETESDSPDLDALVRTMLAAIRPSKLRWVRLRSTPVTP